LLDHRLEQRRMRDWLLLTHCVDRLAEPGKHPHSRPHNGLHPLFWRGDWVAHSNFPSDKDIWEEKNSTEVYWPNRATCPRWGSVFPLWDDPNGGPHSTDRWYKDV